MARRLSQDLVRQAEEAFMHYLRAHRIKYTRPRAAILQTVLHIDEHFEAEQLLAHLRQAGHRVAKATVYRTLPLLVECGILKQVRFSDQQAHYEHAYGEDPHDHMVCRRCGRIIEFSSERVRALREELAAQQGFHSIGHRFQISGLCAACTRRCPAAAWT
jgi:Fur family ferric uptake transcriptional regulator